MILSVLLSLALLSIGHAQSESCSTSYHKLEQDLLSRTENRYQISKAYYPTRSPRPVVVRILYVYPDGTNETWFWSESQFYLIQPLEVFQFTSLFFSNLPSRQTEATIMLSQQCAEVDDEFLETLTQRVKKGKSLSLVCVCGGGGGGGGVARASGMVPLSFCVRV